MVIFSALVRSHQSTSPVASASCVGYAHTHIFKLSMSLPYILTQPANYDIVGGFTVVWLFRWVALQ